MAVTTKVALGADTLNRKWYIDVNDGTHAVPDWVGVFGVTEFTPFTNATKQDDSDFDGNGYKSSAVTALEWGVNLKVSRKTQVADATSYDAGQEILRAAAYEMLGDNRVEIRFYEYKGEAGGPEVEAYQGYAGVEWNPDGGGMDALSTVSIVLSGQGELEAITHPSTAAVPTVTSVAPDTGPTAGGELITIRGTGFAGAIAENPILFGAVAAEEYVVVNDNTIYAVAPAGGAGLVAVSVENATGVSTSNQNYTYVAP